MTTTERKKLGLLPTIATAIVIFVAAAGGMYLGKVVGVTDNPDSEFSPDLFTRLTLKVNTKFPSVPLVDIGYKNIYSQDILHPRGTIVFFMDDGCSPCHRMAIEWERLIQSGIIERDQIVGITFDVAEKLQEVLADYGISFPIYSDELFTFINEHGVDAFPLILVVDKQGMIRYSDYDYRKKFSAKELALLFSGS